MTSPSSFYSTDGLNVETYDERLDTRGTSIEGDAAFYLRLAREAAGPVLELGSGTGRVALELARAGAAVVGLELSDPMRRRAEAKRSGLPPETRRRIHFVAGDMAEFQLDETFPLALVPFRGFQSLDDPERQRRSLDCIRRHLDPGGRLVIDVFDPRLDWCHPVEDEGPAPRGPRGKDGTGALVQRQAVRNPGSGHPIEIEVISRHTDPVHQILSEIWRFTERDDSGRLLRLEEEELRLRWTYRQEMRYLFELTQFTVEAEFSDFHGAPPAYGREQVWMVRRT